MVGHDHLEPSTRAGIGLVDPFLIRAPPGGAAVRPADGGEPVRHLWSDLGMPGGQVDDVIPALSGQEHPTTLRIDNLGQDHQ